MTRRKVLTLLGLATACSKLVMPTGPRLRSTNEAIAQTPCSSFGTAHLIREPQFVGMDECFTQEFLAQMGQAIYSLDQRNRELFLQSRAYRMLMVIKGAFESKP